MREKVEISEGKGVVGGEGGGEGGEDEGSIMLNIYVLKTVQKAAFFR